MIAVCLFSAQGKRPKDLPAILTAAVETMLLHAADDPGSADVCITLPMSGLGSTVKASGARRAMAMGRQMAEQAMPAIKALIG